MTKEELEKEADNYAEKHAFRVPYDGSNKFYDDVDFKASKEGYLAGAEPREKRIAELEEEVKEWKDKADLWCKTANLKDHNIMINKELEKENAELKGLKDVATLIRANNDTVTTLMQLNNMLVSKNQQLTKAKELLKDITSSYGSTEVSEAQMCLKIKKAEQFIKE